jgi:NAD-dependent dihydropyrimidine dehydrogenase PreA subunit
LANGEWKVLSVALDTLRKGAGGVIGGIFVLLLVASFAIWFPAGWFHGYGSEDLITVGDTKIGPHEYMRTQQEMLRAMSAQAGDSPSYFLAYFPANPRGDCMTYVITEACIGVKDRACVDVCPVDCIYEGEDQLYIHPDECIDCGACEPECPVTAIFPEEDVPPQLTSYIEKNKEVFNSDDPPGRPKR